MRYLLLLGVGLCFGGCGTFGPGVRTFELNVLGNTLEVTSETYGPTTIGQPQEPPDASESD